MSEGGAAMSTNADMNVTVPEWVVEISAERDALRSALIMARHYVLLYGDEAEVDQVNAALAVRG